MIRVLALLPYPLETVPGQRYRIEQWAPLLGNEGIELTFSPLLSPEAMRGGAWAKVRDTARGYARRLGEVRSAGAFDLAFLYREMALVGPAWLERLMEKRVPIVLDFDDAIFLQPPVATNSWAQVFRSRSKIRAICGLAQHVTVGNEFLAQFARRHCASVSVIPSTIDTDAYTVREREPNPRPVVGWSGSPTTVCYLNAIAGALARLARSVDFELRVIGGQLSIPGVYTTCHSWNAATEVEDLRPLDVGLMPLTDDDWCRGKCGLKALQYMGLGIPAIVSPVGVNGDIVRDGVNGFHARSEDDWVERIRRVLEDSTLRARLGHEGRRTVEERYSARVQAPRLAELLRRVARP